MTDELKKALESAKSEEEKKALVETFKDEINKLSDKELNEVVGGTGDQVPDIKEAGARYRF